MKREEVIIWLFNKSNVLYRKMKKSTPWGLSTSDLLRFPEYSIGNDLGLFLKKNGFEPLQKSERHDVFHVLTGYRTDVFAEIEMQFYLFGNGKRSFYLFLVLIAGTLIYPEKMRLFLTAAKKGKRALPIHSLSYLNLLGEDIKNFRKEYQITLNTTHHEEA